MATSRRVLVASFAFACLFAPRPAAASDPTAIYVHASRVDFFPDEATATRVAIHGAFFFWMNNGHYSAPKCGYMYFACSPGGETMCRMQWSQINSDIGKALCDGFGSWQMMT